MTLPYLGYKSEQKRLKKATGPGGWLDLVGREAGGETTKEDNS